LAVLIGGAETNKGIISHGLCDEDKEKTKKTHENIKRSCVSHHSKKVAWL